MCWSIISESQLLTFWKPANTDSGICACLDRSSLPLMHLHLFGCLRPQPISAQSGLDWSMANLRIKLISDTNSHTCIVGRVFQHCVNPILKHLHYLKNNLSFYHFFLANVRKQSLKPPNKRQHLKSSHHSLRSAPGDAVHSLSCHGGFADAPMRYKTGITTFWELNKLLKTCSSHPSHFLFLLETHCIIKLFSGIGPPGFQWGLFAQRMQRGCEL